MSLTIRYTKSHLPKRVQKAMAKQQALAEKVTIQMTNLAEQEVRQLTSNWSKPVKIVRRKSFQGRSLEIHSDVFRWLDEGVRPHLIRAQSPGGNLRFPWGAYQARTQRQVFSTSASSGPRGGAIIQVSVVSHPGIKDRGWSETLSGVMTEALQKQLSRVYTAWDL